jgi:DNA (cytosine-5)-methyltransferase 1
MLTFGSLCSGIEAASVAWNKLGWSPAWFSEIDDFANAVLAHHYPNTKNLGDMQTIPRLVYQEKILPPDIVCGGTPCQAFSLSGLRKSLEDSRGNLSLVFCEVANAVDYAREKRKKSPAIIIWENVPGVLRTHDNAFGHFLAGLAGESEALVVPGNKWPNAGIIAGPKRNVAWRVLDAQYFGLAQRRKRVFVVASARTDIDIGQVLFDFEGSQRINKPDREEKKEITQRVGSNSQEHTRFVGLQEVSPALRAESKKSLMSGNCAINTPLAISLSNNKVRQLSPIEYERLQGFSDNYTKIPYKNKSLENCPDSKRYKALGNSWPIPVVSWIGERIQLLISNSQGEHND